eukprot:TRINITY_DN1996_c2_g1_i1.p1 TRINITY_DN1996_c2_g1~~TRINITY_DN1996_c2_g1_i1.p1  ORF type:complete len:240 (+),score=56.92 TRINITY_DN1996_c2_g1_i1:77-796(+)
MALRSAATMLGASMKARLVPSTASMVAGRSPAAMPFSQLAGARRFAAFQPLTKRPVIAAAGAAAPAALNASSRRDVAVVGGVRAMSTWRLRPYAVAGTAAALPMTSLSAGFSKVGLSLLVLPWKALPMALAVVPTVWALPAAYRMIFQNSMRHTTASVFTVILYLVLSFLPVPCFENLFSELTFYGIALVSTFFMYTFFPEVLLHDFMFMHYLALFTVPLIPLAFAYMPMFAARSYLFL